jgi:hypothetical protein
MATTFPPASARPTQTRTTRARMANCERRKCVIVSIEVSGASLRGQARRFALSVHAAKHSIPQDAGLDAPGPSGLAAFALDEMWLAEVGSPSSGRLEPSAPFRLYRYD